MPLFFQCRSGSGSATQIFCHELEWECHSKNKGVLNPLATKYVSFMRILYGNNCERKMDAEVNLALGTESLSLELNQEK